jgi:hypothetical protein
VVWFEWSLDGRSDDAVAFFEFADGLITRVTDFWPEPYEPPAGREHLAERWLPAPARRLRSWTPQELPVDHPEQHDNSDVHDQPRPEVVPEE